jgi:zinc protease
MRTILLTILMALSGSAFCHVQAFQLSNGLKVLVKEDHRAPIAVSMIWYNVGSADEPGDITGVSHAIEHMMFKGTTQFPLGVFSKTIAALGGQENAFTNYDYTAYFEKSDANHLSTSFQLEADRMNHLLLDSQEFAKEIKVIQEERRQRTDDNPQALAFERFLATAHLAAPYNHPVIGWMSSLKQMKVEDLKKWYAQYYAPNNATLVVVGDVDAHNVAALAKQYFGAIPSHPVTQRRPQKEPPALGKKNVTIHAPAKLPLVMIGYSVPSASTAANPKEPYALELIAALLNAGDGSRFPKNLVRTRQIASSADVYYNLYARYTTQFIVFGAPSKSHSVDELQQGLLEELSQLKTTLVSSQELQKVKIQLIAQKTFEKDSIFGQATEIGLLETVGLGWRRGETYAETINQITPEDIQKAAQHFFQEKCRTDAQLIPTKEMHQ